MKTMRRMFLLVAVALMAFTVPVVADNASEFICYPFICD